MNVIDDNTGVEYGFTPDVQKRLWAFLKTGLKVWWKRKIRKNPLCLSRNVDLKKWMKKDNWTIVEATCICGGYEPPENLVYSDDCVTCFEITWVHYCNNISQFFLNEFNRFSSLETYDNNHHFLKQINCYLLLLSLKNNLHCLTLKLKLSLQSI